VKGREKGKGEGWPRIEGEGRVISRPWQHCIYAIWQYTQIAISYRFTINAEHPHTSDLGQDKGWRK